jgi:RES domain-containing protein
MPAATPPLDEEVVQRVNDLGTTPFTGTTYRHTTAGRDPLSGVGARLHGGRWNPAGVCSTIYLAQPLATCLLEFDRLAEANGIDPITMLRSPRTLHTIEVRDLPVLDLRDPDRLAYVGLSPDDIADDDWTACQTVGHAAHFLDMSGIVAASATGQGVVIAAFEARVGPDQLTVTATVPLDEVTYRAGHAR